MKQLIKRFNDGSALKFGRGRFDDWCVYYYPSYNEPYKEPSAIKDVHIFGQLEKLSQTTPHKNLYFDFVVIYDKTTADLDEKVLDEISGLSESYGKNSSQAEFLLTYLYAAMIAEENKKKTKLGKRIKRLGVHQLLAEQMSPEQASNFSRSMTWKDIDKECQSRGF